MGFFALCIVIYIFVEYGSTTRCVLLSLRQATKQCCVFP